VKPSAISNDISLDISVYQSAVNVNDVSLNCFKQLCYNLLLISIAIEVIKMTISKAVAKRILNLCEEREISINKLANLSAITQSTLNSIINGESKNPQLKTIAKICYGLDINLCEFFDSDLFNDLTDLI